MTDKNNTDNTQAEAIPHGRGSFTIAAEDWHKLFEKADDYDERIEKARAMFAKAGCYD